MTAKEISIYFIRRDNRIGQQIRLNNFTPLGWWECDVVEITEAGFLREYEIKLSRSDFFIDSKKKQEKYNRSTREYITEYKHQLLENKSTKAPSKFYYITPEKLIKQEELPKFAGLIEWRYAKYLKNKEDSWKAKNEDELEWIVYENKVIFTEIIKAPQLHKNKVDKKIIDQIYKSCYYRLHDLMFNKMLDDKK